MSRQIQVYSVIVLKGRRFAAFKDAWMSGISLILAHLAGSSWVITPGLQDSPPTLQALAIRKYRSRQVTYWGHEPEGWEGKSRWNHIKLVETEFTPPYQLMPCRSFVMPCRSLCGYDLRRVHVTCWLLCRIRKIFYRKMPSTNELKAVWMIAPDMNRRSRPIRETIFKRITLLMEAAG